MSKSLSALGFFAPLVLALVIAMVRRRKRWAPDDPGIMDSMALGVGAAVVAALVRIRFSPWVELTAQGVAYDRVFGGAGEWLHAKVFSLLHRFGLPFELRSLEGANLANSSIAVGVLAVCAVLLLRDRRRAAFAALLGVLHVDAIAYATTLAEAPLVSLLVPIAVTSLFALAVRPSVLRAVAFVCVTVPLSAARIEAFVLVAVMGIATVVLPTARRPIVAAAVIVSSALGAVWSACSLGLTWFRPLAERSLANLADLRPAVWQVILAGVAWRLVARARRSPARRASIEAWFARLRAFFAPVLGDGTSRGRLPLFLGVAWAGCVLIEVTHNRDNIAMPYARYMLPASPLLFLFIAAVFPRPDRRLFAALGPLHAMVIALFLANEARSVARMPIRFNDQEELRFARTLLPMLRPDDVLVAVLHADLGEIDGTGAGAKPIAIFGPHVKCVVPVVQLPAFLGANGEPRRRVFLYQGIDAVAQTSDIVVPSVADALSRCVWHVEAEKTIPNHPFDLNALDYQSLGSLGAYPIRATGIEHLEGAPRSLTLRLLSIESCRAARP